MKSVSSLQNPLVKEILLLQSKSRQRRQSGKFVFEGLNELRLCLQSGFEVESVLFCCDNISANEVISETGVLEELLIEVTSEIMSKISYRDGVANVMVIAKSKFYQFSDLEKFTNPLYLIAEGIEKPGNLGALLRTADAAGVTAVISANSVCDIYNPNVIRSSVGCTFTVPVVQADTNEVISFLENNKIKVFTTFMDNAHSVWDCNFTEPTAIVLGTEHSGLSDSWQKDEFENINIPMFGKVDSLNVSVAAAALIFEAVRQRSLKK